MKILRVGRGEAPNIADRLAVHMSGCGLYAWSGAIERDGRAIFGGSDPKFKTVHEDERAALGLAMHHGVTEVITEEPDT